MSDQDDQDDQDEKQLDEQQLGVIENLALAGVLGATAYSTRLLVAEVRRHRRAVTADEERVRSVVRTSAMTGVCDAIGRMMGPTYWHDNPGAHATFAAVADAIATRAAKQLATAAVAVSQDERALLDRMLVRLTTYPDDCGPDAAPMVALFLRLLATGAKP